MLTAPATRAARVSRDKRTTAIIHWGSRRLSMLERREFIGSGLAALTVSAQRAPARSLGVTVMPEYIQSEGIGGVLKKLEVAGATAVCTSPYVMEPADEKTGSREPPDDAGAGGVRLLDRPLWGRRELFVRTAPSFAP